MKTDEKSQVIYKIGAYIPQLVLFGIIIFVYSIYTAVNIFLLILSQKISQHQTYLYPLILETYDKQVKLEDEVTLLSQVLMYNDTIFTDLGQQTLKQKGWVLFFILHSLLILLLISIFRTMYTEAGCVPQFWIDEINQDFQQYLENEKLISQRIKQEQQVQRQSFNRSRGTQQGLSIQIVDQLQRDQLNLTIVQNDDQKPLQTKKDDSEVSMNISEEQIIPQSVEQDSELDADIKIQLNLKAKQELIDKKGRRFCKYCIAFKPQRCHHCSQCKRCVLKMDHHCQWVNNCIGFYNYKFFFNLVFYAGLTLQNLIFQELTLLFISFTYSRCVYDYTHSNNVSDLVLYLVILNQSLCVILSVILLLFLIFHIWLITNNRTTLEALEKKSDGGQYNNGIWRNCKSSLGNCPLCWLLPISPYINGNGVEFDKQSYS